MNLAVSHWSANPVVLAVVALVAAIYLRGARAARPAPSQAAAFSAALLLLVVVLVSPVGYWSRYYIWVRSVQDLLLAVVVPALIVLGAPWLVLRGGLRRSGLRRAASQRRGPAGAASAVEEAPGWLRLPIAVTVAFNVAWCGWHLPVPYDAARTQPVVFACEVVTYLGLGVLFWLQLIASRPHVPRLARLRRVALLVGTAVVGAALGMALVFGSAAVYPGYRGSQHHVLSLVADQQMGGAVLWVITLVPYSVAIIALLIGWLNREEDAALGTGLAQLLKPAKSAWPVRPGVR